MLTSLLLFVLLRALEGNHYISEDRSLDKFCDALEGNTAIIHVSVFLFRTLSILVLFFLHIYTD